MVKAKYLRCFYLTSSTKRVFPLQGKLEETSNPLPFTTRPALHSILTCGSRGLTRYWDGGSEMSRITGNNNKKMTANSNLGFPLSALHLY